MKKLISGIMAIAILASAVLCGTTTAFAADTGNSAVGDVEMWNHDFKNKLTGELMWAIDDIADTDTVAVKINWLYTKCWGEERAYKINLKNFQKK